jgi:replicative DNA helicase
MKELALRIGVPAMAGVQAKREVDFRDEQTPEMGDGQWASSIEQVADKIFGIWRPFVTSSEKSHLNIKYQGQMHQLKITPELAILKMRKQRGDIGQFTWYLHFSPANLKLCEMELQQEHQSPTGPAWGGGDHG